MKILIVDDEERIRNVIKEYISMEGYSFIEAKNGIEALDIIENETIDMIILDIMMPKLDGISLLKKIPFKIPTIILSARGEVETKLEGFSLGIDDYLSKPFSPKELVARIKALAKRSGLLIDNFKYKDLEINIMSRDVLIKGQKIKLTPKEYDLLLLFIQNINIALSRETILNKIWGFDYFGDGRTVDTHVKSLRNALGDYRDLIQTVRAVGYKFEINDK